LRRAGGELGLQVIPGHGRSPFALERSRTLVEFARLGDGKRDSRVSEAISDPGNQLQPLVGGQALHVIENQ
jgi:hypothetical protein